MQRLKDKDTKEAFTRVLARKVSRITPTIQKLHAQLQGKQISPQSFADTANTEITSILQKTALEILTQIDSQTSPHTRTTSNSHVQDSRANHHSSKDPHEALLQRTIQFHRDTLGTLRKDLSLDDADTLAYHQNKLKQAQIDLLNSQTKKMQDKLLANVVCDHGDAGNTSGQNPGSMWNYLRKYKNNHAKNSLPPETRSNASTDARIWESGPLTLNPLNWHCYRFALGHHLFKHKLSPYDEKEATLISSATIPYKRRRPPPHQAPIPSSCYPLPYLNSPPRSRNCLQTNPLALLASLTGCYKLVTLNFSPSSYYSSMVCGNPTCNLPTGNSPSCNQSTKDMLRTKLTLPPTGAYVSMRSEEHTSELQSR